MLIYFCPQQGGVFAAGTGPLLHGASRHQADWGITRLTSHRLEPSLAYVIVAVAASPGSTMRATLFGEPLEEVQSWPFLYTF